MTITERLLHHVSFDTQSDESSETCPSTAKQKLLGEALVEEMRAMGIADSIVNLAFGLTLGAVAVAFALAFGLGGRAPAERVLTDLIDKAKKEGCQPNPVKEQARACGFGTSASSAAAQPDPLDDGYTVQHQEAPGVVEKETATPDQLDVDPAQQPVNNPFGSKGEKEEGVDTHAPPKNDPE